MSAQQPIIAPESPRRIVVRTGCRLHFGLLSVGRSSGRQFGGAGVMLDSPGWEIACSPAPSDTIIAADEVHARIVTTLQRLRKLSAAESATPGIRVEVLRQIPRHAGLGSGTQLGLAIAQGWNLLQGHAPRHAVELALQAGRGLRSAIGVHGFDLGGFLVEAGKLGDEISPLVTRESFPGDWRFVLIRPTSTRGLSDQAELQGFAALAPMPESTTARLWQILESQLTPAVRSHDFDTCSAAIHEFGRLVGEYFAPAQGDIYASPQMVQLASRLFRDGFHGISQTSWGPTLFVLCRNDSSARALADELAHSPDARDCQISLCSPRNHGATHARS